MPGKIVNHFRILLAQKPTRQQQNIALIDLQRETGIDWSTLNFWAKYLLTRYDGSEVKALCLYFDSRVVDLLVIEKEKCNSMVLFPPIIAKNAEKS